ncbi:MAG: hypothetical protein ACD_75C01637G0001 [uncultured bacterium]|nr:MAG: hypothetical protein ACD_75C01637G0001 [uncultured bacterium]
MAMMASADHQKASGPKLLGKLKGCAGNGSWVRHMGPLTLAVLLRQSSNGTRLVSRYQSGKPCWGGELFITCGTIGPTSSRTASALENNERASTGANSNPAQRFFRVMGISPFSARHISERTTRCTRTVSSLCDCCSQVQETCH